MPLPDCAFCEIISGAVDSAIVFEDADTLAFLDFRPVFPGHVLLVPRVHHETLPDLPRDLLAPLFGNAQLLAAAVTEALGAQGTFVAMNNVVSQSVPHVHVHIVPRTKGDGLRGFFWPRHSYEDADHMEQIRSAIAAAARTS